MWKKSTNWDLQQVTDKKWYFGDNAAAAVSQPNMVMQPRRGENYTQSISFCLQTWLIIYPESTWKQTWDRLVLFSWLFHSCYPLSHEVLDHWSSGMMMCVLQLLFCFLALLLNGTQLKSLMGRRVILSPRCGIFCTGLGVVCEGETQSAANFHSQRINLIRLITSDRKCETIKTTAPHSVSKERKQPGLTLWDVR